MEEQEILARIRLELRNILFSTPSGILHQLWNLVLSGASFSDGEQKKAARATLYDVVDRVNKRYAAQLRASDSTGTDSEDPNNILDRCFTELRDSMLVFEDYLRMAEAQKSFFAETVEDIVFGGLDNLADLLNQQLKEKESE